MYLCNDILFSPELYKYLGNGFDCSFVGDDIKNSEAKGWWRINYADRYVNNNGEYNNLMNPSEDPVFTVTQAYPTLSNWNILKAIIIGLNSLPVVEEYLPISNKDGFLTHYNTPEYKKALEDLGIEHNVIREIF